MVLSIRLRLLGWFELRVARCALPLPSTAQRLVALLALHVGPLPRSRLSGILWPEAGEDRARASLRSALWELRQRADGVVESDSNGIRLTTNIGVDYRKRMALALRIANATVDCRPADLDWRPFTVDLLPGWYEEWVLPEQERYCELRLRALEALSDRLLCLNRVAEAIPVALAATSSDPLRETAHKVLLRGLLAEGNQARAIRMFEAFKARLGDELGLEPSFDLRELVAISKPLASTSA